MSVNNCCGDFANCYRHCDVRGLAARAGMAPRSHFAGRAPSLGSGEISLPALPPTGPCCADRYRCWPPYERHPENCLHRQPKARKVGLIERLIAGPRHLLADRPSARRVPAFLGRFSGDARLYELSPPMPYRTWRRGAELHLLASHVVVSAASPVGHPETYIFPADRNGNVLDWLELDGSFQGDIDHRRALIGAGYELAERDPSLREDFLSFLGCLAVGTGFALVIIAVVMAARVLLGAQS